jgi:hypothetical protein
MDDKAGRVGDYLRAYSRLAGLNLSAERLKELEPEFAALYADMRKLWAIPVGETESALGFSTERQDDNV